MTEDIAQHRSQKHDRLREHGGDFTPTPVVRQLMWHLKSRGHWFESHFDPTAGAGVFSACVRETFPSCRSTALEIREEESDHLNENAHTWSTSWDCMKALQEMPPFLEEQAPFDLCATNPKFQLLSNDALLPLLLRVMRPGGLVVLLASDDMGQRGTYSRMLWAQYPPFRQLRIPGTLKFRKGSNPDTGKPYGVDFRSYSWWLWQADGEGGCFGNGKWICDDLPLLPSEDRKWDKVRPGTEYLYG